MHTFSPDVFFLDGRNLVLYQFRPSLDTSNVILKRDFLPWYEGFLKLMVQACIQFLNDVRKPYVYPHNCILIFFSFMIAYYFEMLLSICFFLFENPFSFFFFFKKTTL